MTYKIYDASHAKIPMFRYVVWEDDKSLASGHAFTRAAAESLAKAYISTHS